ncbi:MAG: hypothetical protein COZ70_12825 [Deltaproteobacteria bacterium CG_4_8_14_3_um_filter_51_11]|nr:hypothetical protein [bacterium]OIP42767.1 MAG: hypothetical protein AUK25_03250 [Desulfobacteraceae bacterium CG2_30_51_40]PIP46656.1 MAG: hypothetical protein COX16_08515 [Deltaproteobacteria bacterium CG23_combo_of_CG06-09_8_20_14_all_51_20]PIX18711.1 MAG: hypothetical protein COZ70_12825 [Deltaproteobacteria bacterium CG_4_8_14_3_um_filter_51_11]PIY22722.1 MAG: hypothetical protein COZ11_11595 [Deltaproteobacteria bacterium CG_4_10_14_3_um_filter_51_14]
MPHVQIRLSDLIRATLPEESGNEGYIGISPDGSAYHVVAPVDRLIARGLKFWERPDDGTPFGGFRGWRYFLCLTYPPPSGKGPDRHTETARENGYLLKKWALAQNIEMEFIDDLTVH